jgi:GntR family transcriptional regulator / MocR family aminotransferase
MRIPIDRQGGVPLYRQIESYLRQGILSGSLAAETRLPASRQLAKSLGVNRITVESAYAELEADGLVYSQVGSGTYVLPPIPLPPLPKSDPGSPWPLWQEDLRKQQKSSRDYRTDHLLRSSRIAEPIDLSQGIGDEQVYPAEDFRKILQTVLRRDGVAAMGYENYEGYLPLRTTITHVLASQGLQTAPEQVLITAGSQQGISLVSQFLLKPGDSVLVEEPTYNGALNLFRYLSARIIGIPTDERGMRVEKLEKLLQQHHPKLIYTIPNFHNPTGVSLDLPRRRRLIDLADRYNVPILEDDFVGDLRYDGRVQPALKALDPGGRVIYASTFSKMVMPGLRVGFLVADGPVFDGLVQWKRVVDLSSSSLIQRALEAFVTVGRYQAHLRRSCQIYRKRRDAMLESIEHHLPAGVYAASPSGGLFIWLRQPVGISSEKLLPLACQEGVAYAPGSLFFNNSVVGEAFMRLNFAAYPPDKIDEGIKRLAKAIKRYARINPERPG